MEGLECNDLKLLNIERKIRWDERWDGGGNGGDGPHKWKGCHKASKLKLRREQIPSTLLLSHPRIVTVLFLFSLFPSYLTGSLQILHSLDLSQDSISPFLFQESYFILFYFTLPFNSLYLYSPRHPQYLHHACLSASFSCHDTPTSHLHDPLSCL